MTSTDSKPSITAEEKVDEPKSEDVDPANIELPVSPTDGTPPPNSIFTTTATPPSSYPTPGKVIFIYTCPTTSAVRHRMLYSSALRGVIKDAEDKGGFKVEKRVSRKGKADV